MAEDDEPQAYQKMQDGLREFQNLVQELQDQGSSRPEMVAAARLKDKYSPKPVPFGHIPGLKPGQQFSSRGQLVVLGLHRKMQADVDFEKGKAAYAVVLPPAAAPAASGSDSEGEGAATGLWCTGFGGRDPDGKQVDDQKMAHDNAAMKQSLDDGTPVRVFREVGSGGPGSPGAGKGPKKATKSSGQQAAKGLRYEGLFKVTQHKQERDSKSRKMVFRFRLEPAPHLPSAPAAAAAAPAAASAAPAAAAASKDGAQAAKPAAAAAAAPAATPPAAASKQVAASKDGAQAAKPAAAAAAAPAATPPAAASKQVAASKDGAQAAKPAAAAAAAPAAATNSKKQVAAKEAAAEAAAGKQAGPILSAAPVAASAAAPPPAAAPNKDAAAATPADKAKDAAKTKTADKAAADKAAAATPKPAASKPPPAAEQPAPAAAAAPDAGGAQAAPPAAPAAEPAVSAPAAKKASSKSSDKEKKAPAAAGGKRPLPADSEPAAPPAAASAAAAAADEAQPPPAKRQRTAPEQQAQTVQEQQRKKKKQDKDAQQEPPPQQQHAEKRRRPASPPREVPAAPEQPQQQEPQQQAQPPEVHPPPEQQQQQPHLAREGLVIPDITGGTEAVAIPLYDELQLGVRLPPGFRYTPDYVWGPGTEEQVAPALSLERQRMLDFTGMKAGKECGLMFNQRMHDQDMSLKAAGRLPPQYEATNAESYTPEGLLRTTDPCGIHECSAACRGSACAGNMQVTRGVSQPLEMFVTAERTLGVRCSRDIPAGTFVCCIIGELISADQMVDRIQSDPEAAGSITPLDHVMCIFRQLQYDGVDDLNIQLPDHKVPPPPRCNHTGGNGGSIASTATAVGYNGLNRQQLPAGAGSAAFPSPTALIPNEALVPPDAFQARLAVDNSRIGNVGRFIRQSPEGNLTVQVVFAKEWRSTLVYYLALFACMDVKPGEELILEARADDDEGEEVLQQMQL